MRIIEPSYEILDRNGWTLTQKMEQAGRIAYKSEDKITADSAIPFCEKMLKSGHFPVIEFANIHIFVEMDESYYHVLAMSELMMALHPMKYLNISTVVDKENKVLGIILSGTVRAFLDKITEYSRNETVSEVFWSIAICVSEVIGEPFFGKKIKDSPKSEYKCRSISAKEVIDMLGNGGFDDHLMCAVKFIGNRAFTHELVRHRPCSFIQESQRYCRYSNDKFGNGVTFISPSAFWKRGTKEYRQWTEAMLLAETIYIELLDTSSPQAARTVLPNSCKTEIIVFTTITEWKHIFKLRDSTAAEPSMVQIMKPLHAEFFEPHNITKWE